MKRTKKIVVGAGIITTVIAIALTMLFLSSFGPRVVKAKDITYIPVATWEELSDALSGASTTGREYIELSADINREGTITLDVIAASDVVLKLNGHVIDGNGTGPVINVNGSLTLRDVESGEDASETENTVTVYYYNEASSSIATKEEVIIGGVVTGGSATNGGGVTVNPGGAFTLEGGTIAGNTSTGTFNSTDYQGNGGGGVYVYSSADGIAKFYMTGGKISGNTAAVGGGGVMVNGSLASYKSVFETSGGEISGNIASFRAGGLFILHGTATMNEGSVISENRSMGIAGGVQVTGGNGTLAMNGGVINNNIASEEGGGAYLGNSGTSGAGTLTMLGGKISGNKSGEDGGGVYSVYGGRLNMNGGEISGNSAANGGGVAVYAVNANTSFIMNGGDALISNNTATNGGGVYVTNYTNNATFNMIAGVISDNTASTDVRAGYGGGGVFVKGNSGTSTFGLSGGEIKNNSAGNGGGVYMFSQSSSGTSNAKMTMSGGRIFGNKSLNTSTGTTASYVHGGGGIALVSYPLQYTNATTTFDMSGGEICSNTSTRDGGGVYAKSINSYAVGTTTINVTGGKICHNKARNGGGVFTTANEKLTLTNATIEGNEATINGGGLYLSANAALTVQNGEISGNKAPYGGGIYVAAGNTLTVKGTASVNNNEATISGGGIFVAGSEGILGTLNFEGGEIVDNKASYNGGGTGNGGGVYVDAYGKFKMSGGNISGNDAGTSGGGVYVNSSFNMGVIGLGEFTMTGGSVSGNKAEVGGGLYNKGTFNIQSGEIDGNNADQGGGVYFAADITGSLVNIEGGKISNNDAASLGGGMLLLGAAGTVTMSSGEISGNNAGSSMGGGGGIFNNLMGTNPLTLSGDATITGNIGSTVINSSSFKCASNIYNNTDKYVYIDSDALNPFTGTIGITTATNPEENASVSGVKSNDESLSTSSFFSDLGYTVGKDGVTGEIVVEFVDITTIDTVTLDQSTVNKSYTALEYFDTSGLNANVTFNDGKPDVTMYALVVAGDNERLKIGTDKTVGVNIFVNGEVFENPQYVNSINIVAADFENDHMGSISLNKTEFVYTGSAQTIDLLNISYGVTVESIVYKDNLGTVLPNGAIVPGTYTAEVVYECSPDYYEMSNNSDYLFTDTYSFEITKAVPDPDSIAFTGKSVAYTGTAQTITIADTEGVTIEKYEYFDKNNKKIDSAIAAGTYTVKATLLYSSDIFEPFSGTNYTTTKSATLTITPIALTVSDASAEGKVYDRKTSVTVSGTLGGGVIGNDTVSLSTTGTVISSAVGTNKPVTFSLTGADAGNYTISTQPDVKVDITKATVNVDDITPTDRAYNALTSIAHTGTLGGVYSGDTVTVSCAVADKKVGVDKTVTLTLGGTSAGNYQLPTYTKTVTISQAEVDISAITATGREYNGEKSVTFTGALDGVFTDDVVGITAEASSKDAGTNDVIFTLTGADAGNYKVPEHNKTVTIAKAVLGVSGIEAVTNRVYDGKTAVTLTGALTGIVGTEDVSVTGAADNAGAGTRALILSLAGADASNYELPAYTKSVTIAKAVLNVVPGNQTITYGEVIDQDIFTIVGFVNNEDESVVGGAKPSLTASSLKAGSGTVSIGVNGMTADNYSFTAGTDGALTVNKKTITITGVETEDRIYNGTTVVALTGGTLAGLESGDDVSIVLGSGSMTDKNTGAGKAVTTNIGLSGDDADNYDLTQPSGLTVDISAAALTIENVLAAGRAYNGTTAVTLTGGTLVGIIGSDGALLSFTLNSGTLANADAGLNKNVTTNIVLTGTEKDNYSLAQPTISVDISKVMLTVTAEAQTIIYGQSIDQTKYTITGFITGEGSSVVTGTPTLTASSLNAGSRKISVNAGNMTATNYTFTAGTDAALTINKATYNMSAIKFENATVDYDGTAKSILISGTLPTGVSVSYTGNGQDKGGIYTIIAAFTGDADNYNLIGSMSATLTITIKISMPDIEGVSSDFLKDYIPGDKLPEPDRNGYDFVAWYTSPDFADSSKVTSINTNTSLYAKWGVAKPDVSVDAKSTTNENGKDATLSMKVNEVEGLTYTYQWQKLVKGEWVNVEGATSTTLELTKRNQSGTYQMLITVTDGTTTEQVATSKVDVEVHRFSGGAIAGVVVGSVLAFLILVYVLGYFLLYKRSVLLVAGVWSTVYVPMNYLFGKKDSEAEKSETTEE